jgi:hypothetical protein
MLRRMTINVDESLLERLGETTRPEIFNDSLGLFMLCRGLKWAYGAQVKGQRVL